MRTVTKKECPFCHKMISNSNFNRHIGPCKDGKYIPKLEKYHLDDGLYHCPYCDKIYEKIRQLDGHIRLQHERKWNPRDFIQTYWCEGQTKDTDEKVKQISEKLKDGYASGRIKKYWQGKKMPKNACLKMSKSRKELLRNRPELHPNRILANNRKKMSYPEGLVYDQLIESNIDFIHQYLIYPYFVDFYLYDLDIILEVDGEYWHSSDEQKENDFNRDKYIINQGYTIKRIPAKNVLSSLEVFLDDLK